jgi:accessory gene regulator protein AgrB
MTPMARPEPFSKEDMARRRKRAIVMALVLVAFAALFFITTMVRLGSTIAERTL